MNLIDTDAEFKPLIAQQIQPAQPAAEPVSWFTVISPFSEGVAASSVTPMPVGASENDDAPALHFADLDILAEQERVRKQAGEPDPPEIVQLREQTMHAAIKILTQAKIEAEELKEAARKEGYAAGYAQGYADAEADARHKLTLELEEERQALRQDVAALLQHIEAARKNLWQRMEPEMLELTLEMAQKVLKQEVEASRTTAVALVQNALRRAADSQTLRVRVHETDLEAVRAAKSDLLMLVDGLQHLEIISDRRVQPGGALVETEAGTIDARMETQIAVLEESMQDLQTRRNPPGEAA